MDQETSDFWSSSWNGVTSLWGDVVFSFRCRLRFFFYVTPITPLTSHALQLIPVVMFYGEYSFRINLIIYWSVFVEELFRHYCLAIFSEQKSYDSRETLETRTSCCVYIKQFWRKAGDYVRFLPRFNEISKRSFSYAFGIA